MNDPDINVVGICTPSHEHLGRSPRRLAAGKHVLCEKPMTADVNECREIVELSRTARSKMIVRFQMRFHPVVPRSTDCFREFDPSITSISISASTGPASIGDTVCSKGAAF